MLSVTGDLEFFFQIAGKLSSLVILVFIIAMLGNGHAVLELIIILFILS